MTPRLLSIGLVLALITQVHAADTPDTTAAPEPTATERLANARSAVDAKNWQRALTELRAALQAAPDNADVHNLLGFSYRKQAKPDLPKAFEHYRQALKLNPTHRGAHEYIGEAYLMDNKPAEAERHLAELEKICGNRSCEEYADLAKAIADFKPPK
ncbi:MAG: tetratricopeptide repeat protein [Polaromonas sp.]|nr:tetratricopeptide repeat protein [Polaromonas sp.]